MQLFGKDLEREVAVVAEVGVNHEGDVAVAEALVRAAAAAGADAVKFQTCTPERFARRPTRRGSRGSRGSGSTTPPIATSPPWPGRRDRLLLDRRHRGRGALSRRAGAGDQDRQRRHRLRGRDPRVGEDRPAGDPVDRVTDRRADREFRDHALSFEPAELAALVRAVGRVRASLGEPAKRVQPAEEPLRPLMRKGVVAARDLPAGTVLRDSDLMYARPATEFASGERPALVGRRLLRDLKTGELVPRSAVAP